MWSSSQKQNLLYNMMQKAQNQWYNVDWKRCENEIAKLQNSGVIAAKRGDHEEIKRLQETIVRTYSARALAVRKVTSNRGKRSAGVDGQTWQTEAQKSKAIQSLKNLAQYEPKPVKRVWIPKPGRSEKRPLGIPTIYDRAVQALLLQALEPVAETQADPRSYGFRKGRSVHDIAEYVRLLCASMYGKRYVLEIHIRKFFDTIDHNWLLQNTPLNNNMLRKLLYANYCRPAYFIWHNTAKARRAFHKEALSAQLSQILP